MEYKEKTRRKKKCWARATELVEKEKETRLERQEEVRLCTGFEAILRTLVFTKVKNQREQRLCEVLSRVESLCDFCFNSFSLTTLSGKAYGGRKRGKGSEISEEIITAIQEKDDCGFLSEW